MEPPLVPSASFGTADRINENLERILEVQHIQRDLAASSLAQQDATREAAQSSAASNAKVANDKSLIINNKIGIIAIVVAVIGIVLATALWLYDHREKAAIAPSLSPVPVVGSPRPSTKPSSAHAPKPHASHK